MRHCAPVLRSKVKVTFSTSHLCLFFIWETKCCTCAIRGGRGHTVSAEPGGHTSCYFTFYSSSVALILNLPFYLCYNVNAMLMSLNSLLCADVPLRNYSLTPPPPPRQGVCRSGYYQLRQMRSVARSLSEDGAKAVVNAFISCRLDYCNSLLSGVSDCPVQRLQSVQNAAARFVTGTRRHAGVEASSLAADA